MASLKYHILKEYANGVMDEKGRFYPYKSKSLTTTGTLVPNATNRIYVKSVSWSCSTYGITADQTFGVSGMVNKVTTYCMAVASEATTLATEYFSISGSQNVGLLFDRGATLTATAGGYATAKSLVVYAEIDELEGEYSG